MTGSQTAAVALSPRIGEGAYKLLGRGRKEREFLGRVGDGSHSLLIGKMFNMNKLNRESRANKRWGTIKMDY